MLDNLTFAFVVVVVGLLHNLLCKQTGPQFYLTLAYKSSSAQQQQWRNRLDIIVIV